MPAHGGGNHVSQIRAGIRHAGCRHSRRGFCTRSLRRCWRQWGHRLDPRGIGACIADDPARIGPVLWRAGKSKELSFCPAPMRCRGCDCFPSMDCNRLYACFRGHGFHVWQLDRRGQCLDADESGECPRGHDLARKHFRPVPADLCRHHARADGWRLGRPGPIHLGAFARCGA